MKCFSLLFLILHFQAFGQLVEFDKSRFEIIEFNTTVPLLHWIKQHDCGLEQRFIERITQDSLVLYALQEATHNYLFEEVKNTDPVQLTFWPFDNFQVVKSDYFFVYKKEKGWLSNRACVDSVQFSSDGLSYVTIESRSDYGRRLVTLEDLSGIQLLRDSKTKAIVAVSLILKNKYKLLPSVWIDKNDLYKSFKFN